MINITIFVGMMALAGDFMHSMGKMYVVVAVVVLILVGLFAYMTYIDRKISRVEKQIKQNHDR